ncbi:MAG: hypothetical protein ACI89U_001652 [Gammaproteobacteria bacterium]
MGGHAAINHRDIRSFLIIYPSGLILIIELTVIPCTIAVIILFFRKNDLTSKTINESGKVVSIVDKVYSLKKIVEAHQRVETEQWTGIVVLPFDFKQKSK